METLTLFMRTLLRLFLRRVLRAYPFERGKYSILTKIFLSHAAPLAGTPIITRLKFGLRMKLDPAEYLQAHLYAFGDYELPTIRFIRSFLTRDAVCCDVGAQMGYLSLAMATAAEGTTTVHAFEPESVNAERFAENVALNGLRNVSLHRTAVSNVDGMLRLYLSNDRNAGTHSTIANSSNVSDEFVEIPSTTLDSFAAAQALERLDLIKIDVEGAEFDVLRGADRVLRTLRPCVILELSDALQQQRGMTSKDIKVFMADRGYSAYAINDDGTLVASAPDATHINDNVVFLATS